MTAQNIEGGMDKASITIESGPVDENLVNAIDSSTSIEGIIESLEQSPIEGIRDFSSEAYSKKDITTNLVDLEAFAASITKEGLRNEGSRADILKNINTYLNRVPTSYHLQERVRTFLFDINPLLRDFTF